MTEPLPRALSRLRAVLLDDGALVRAVASGRRKGQSQPWRRAELRYVDLKAGRRLQIVTFDDTQSFTANHVLGEGARDAVDDLLDQAFANWHVETAEETLQLRVTKRGEALLHATPRRDDGDPSRSHDRAKPRLLAEDDPVLRVLGIADDQGRVKPTKRGKYMQVEEFLRLLDQTVSRALETGKLRTPATDEPLRITDLGCGNAYLTFAADRFLAGRGLPVRLTGVDVKAQSLSHNRAVADRLGIEADFVQSAIGETELDPAPEVVLALHACDTATDDALAKAVTWRAPVILAAPCCHHDIAAQLRRQPTPAPYDALTRDGILRERLADTLTDAVRASLLRLHGYRVDVVEFVGSEHTPRNTMIRAVRTGAAPKPAERAAYDEMVRAWRIEPTLARLLGA